MKNTFLFIMIALAPVILFGQSGETPPCVSCIENEVNTKDGASALGTQNISSNVNSFATGYQSESLGEYAVAMGKMAAANGNKSFALGLHSEANGTSSMALGPYTLTMEDALVSIALGSRVTAVVERSMVLGFGVPTNPLVNNIPYSLMAAFNTDVPTFFIGPGTGPGTMGKIGIGTTNPTQLLEVNGNIKVNDYSFLNHLTVENVIINSSLNMSSQAITNISFLKGNGQLKLQSIIGGEADVTINTDGKVGIGTEAPSHLLEVDGDFSVHDNATFLDKVGIGTSSAPTERLVVNGNIKTSGIQIDNGLQGDGKLLVSDANGFATWTDQSSINDNDWTTVPTGIYTNESVGIGIEPVDYLFEVNGTSNFQGEIYQNGQELISSLWQGDTYGISSPGSNVGIGCESSNAAKLLVNDATDLNNIVAHFKDSEDRRLIFVPKLSNNGYNPLSRLGDAGIFWSDNGASGSGQNASAGLVIAPHLSTIGFAGIRINNDGKVGINTYNPDSELTVAGIVHAQEVKVSVNAGADFVFNDNYELPSLVDLEEFLHKNKHLPGIAPEKEMLEEGLELGGMQIKLLQKIEELTLYIIEQEKRIDKLEKEHSK
ncbi:MAG: hypothetical protein K9H58_16380 [Bacteroidales bacterium]|nr:hypothetical protein [Bacteroidales bacterium]